MAGRRNYLYTNGSVDCCAVCDVCFLFAKDVALCASFFACSFTRRRAERSNVRSSSSLSLSKQLVLVAIAHGILQHPSFLIPAGILWAARLGAE